MVIRKTFVLLALAASVSGCRARVMRHDQNVAAHKALEFLQHAVVEQDYAAAYAMAREEDKRTLTLAQFTDTVKKSHPGGFPVSLQAIEYEPVPGQPAIQIFLVGKNPQEVFYYRVPMDGTVDDGYFPKGLYRGNQPYPPSGLRQALNE